MSTTRNTWNSLCICVYFFLDYSEIQHYFYNFLQPPDVLLSLVVEETERQTIAEGSLFRCCREIHFLNICNEEVTVVLKMIQDTWPTLRRSGFLLQCFSNVDPPQGWHMAAIQKYWHE